MRVKLKEEQKRTLTSRYNTEKRSRMTDDRERKRERERERERQRKSELNSTVLL